VSAAERAAVAAASGLALEHSPVSADQLVSGSPSTGERSLGTTGDREYGVWEMTPGAMRDEEVDEVSIVIAGRATVDFEDGSRLTLGPGDVFRLEAGARTVWTVTETLRKLYTVEA
jgi:uncharacterized cupin superfamily protein